MSIETGGVAFPLTSDAVNYTNRQGMTLRDYFAAKALQGLLAGEMEIALDPSQFCQSAYVYADAMIKERNKG